ncbi:polymer-forming cytoskeletal protein [Heyndrickxia sporothermodurans]|uniref:Cytoplasmic protein n=1 Tax=Heyndrickxia sporothermodurans TaxID=46224 RepID=A0A150L5T2_9BACI|nr:polymer-forming cytoskeletal protein [Heyndrickxia sporothermodurans]KYD07062.1 hypothetical protein B4102_2007 [Heyndrickxia sporothermodurans]
MERRNLNIFGSGSYSGGHYAKVKIKGDGTVTSDIDCQEFKTHGNSQLLGNVKAESFIIYGTVDIKENLKSNVVKINGTMDSNGDISGHQILIRGNGEIDGNLYGETVEVKGSLSVNGNCEVETFQLDGGFQIGGLLNAGSINIGMKYGESRVNEIGGESITIRKKPSFLGLSKHFGKMTTELIEGDIIYIEYTDAKIVRGNNIEIGPGCNIEIVEYKENFKQHKNSNVKENRKI